MLDGRKPDAQLGRVDAALQLGPLLGGPVRKGSKAARLLVSAFFSAALRLSSLRTAMSLFTAVLTTWPAAMSQPGCSTLLMIAAHSLQLARQLLIVVFILCRPGLPARGCASSDKMLP